MGFDLDPCAFQTGILNASWSKVFLPISSMSVSRIELVIARFHEDLSWIRELPDIFSKIVIYNKGTPIEIEIPKSEIHTLPNLGMNGYAYLYHVINNYNNLADVTIFTLGSAWSDSYKKRKLLETINSVIKLGTSIEVDLVTNYDVVSNEHFFFINSHQFTCNENFQINKDYNLLPCKDRPLGKWFCKHFPNEILHGVSYKSIFAASKVDILKRDVSFYKILFEETSYKSPEVEHYLERVWQHIFSIPIECYINF